MEIGTLGGRYTDAAAISDTGYVVGQSAIAAVDEQGRPIYHAFRWNAGVMEDLGTLGGAESGARSVNSPGQAVGNADDADGHARAVLWLPEPAYGLPAGTNSLVPDESRTSASQINEQGQIVIYRDLEDVYLWFPEPFHEFPAGLTSWNAVAPRECRYPSTVLLNDRGELAGSCLWLPSADYELSAGWQLLTPSDCLTVCDSFQMFQRLVDFSNAGVALTDFECQWCWERLGMLSAYDLATQEAWMVAVNPSSGAVNDQGVIVSGYIVDAWRSFGERYDIRERVLLRDELRIGELIDINNGGVIVASCSSARGLGSPGCVSVPADLDFDENGATDAGDYRAFVDCFMGAETEPSAGCVRYDVDRNGRVDLGDFQALQLAFGP